LNYFAIAFGATIHLEYEITEEGSAKKRFPITLESGDAFVTNSRVTNISYQVKETTNSYKQELVMRDGCLLLTAERD
jgi:hypothetical protein